MRWMIVLLLAGCAAQPTPTEELEFRACHMSVVGEDQHGYQILLVCDKPVTIKPEKEGS